MVDETRKEILLRHVPTALPAMIVCSLIAMTGMHSQSRLEAGSSPFR